MVVDADGRAYITQLGFDLFRGADPVPSPLLVVEPDGTARALTDLGGLMCGNGIAITPDGGTLVAVEAYGVTVLAFDRAADGTLSNRRTFATLPAPGDGMCLDAEGAAWIASPAGGVVVRVTEGGAATDLVTFDVTEAIPTSCVLGGEDRRTLYVTAGTEVFDWEKSRRESTGTVWTAPVAVGGGAARP
jgi:sugar lactone lactonase YvrE